MRIKKIKVSIEEHNEMAWGYFGLDTYNYIRPLFWTTMLLSIISSSRIDNLAEALAYLLFGTIAGSVTLIADLILLPFKLLAAVSFGDKQ